MHMQHSDGGWKGELRTWFLEEGSGKVPAYLPPDSIHLWFTGERHTCGPCVQDMRLTIRGFRRLPASRCPVRSEAPQIKRLSLHIWDELHLYRDSGEVETVAPLSCQTRHGTAVRRRG